jgi:hypothetical protein
MKATEAIFFAVSGIAWSIVIPEQMPLGTLTWKDEVTIVPFCRFLHAWAYEANGALRMWSWEGMQETAYWGELHGLHASVYLTRLGVEGYYSFDHTQWHTTGGRTSLNEGSARRRNPYLGTHNTHNRQTSMSPAGFEPAIPASDRLQTHALDDNY